MRLGLRRWWNRLDSWWRARRSGLSDEAFVEAVYQELLGRRPDLQARDDALQSLRRGALTRGQLRQMLSRSPEHRAYGLVLDLYQGMLGRPPTDEERWAGVQLLEQGGMDPALLRQAVADTVDYLYQVTPVPPDEVPYHAAVPPTEVWLELTTRCNMVPPCIMCGRTAISDPDWHDMDPLTWQRLLPVLQQAHVVGLHGGGEPLLYPQIFDLLDHLDPQRTEVGFNTNGRLLTPRNSRRLIEAQVAWISVSLDAASPGMYLRLRQVDRFEQVLAKIRQLDALKAELGSARPRVEVNMTVMCANLPEVPRFVELAAELDAAKVMFQQIKPGGDWVREAPDGYHFDYQQEELRNCPQAHAEAMAQAWERADDLGVRMEYEIVYRETGADWPEERVRNFSLEELGGVEGREPHPAMAQAPAGALCTDPWTNLLVYVDGEATFCCYHYPKSILGNVRDQPFAEVWNGPRARTIRQLVLGTSPPRCCRGCFHTPVS